MTTRPLELGLLLIGLNSVPEMAEEARRAEELGSDVVLLGDHLNSHVFPDLFAQHRQGLIESTQVGNQPHSQHVPDRTQVICGHLEQRDTSDRVRRNASVVRGRARDAAHGRPRPSGSAGHLRLDR